MGLMDLFRRRATGGPSSMRARLEGAMARHRLRGWNPPLENINALVASGGPRLLHERENAADARRAADLRLHYRTSPSETQGARATPATRPDPGSDSQQE